MNKDSHLQTGQAESCSCFSVPISFAVTEIDLGMDSNYAEVTLHSCPKCSQLWLRYFYEQEAFTASGRWYLGAVTTEKVAHLNAENSKTTLEGLSWYFFGGSYYEGQSGKASGEIFLIP